MKNYGVVLKVAIVPVLILFAAGWAEADAEPHPLSSIGPDPGPDIDVATGMRLGPNDVRNSADDSASVTSTGWKKHPGNPVMDVGVPPAWDSVSASLPSVMLDGDVYKMWYSGYNGDNTYRIGYATSPDGANWSKHPNNPVLSEGPAGSWDSGYAIAPHVVFHDGVYRMWYRGTDDAGLSVGASIGYATSADGVIWVKHAGNPVLSVGPPGSWDSARLWSECVITEGTTYKMWYSGSDDADNSRIGYATSPDGVEWTKYAGNPVLDIGPPESWDSRFVYYPVVVFNGSVYEMWYSGYNGSDFRIGYATSDNGTSWIKHSENPILGTGPAGSWDSVWVLSSSVILQGDNYEMWYSGNDGSNSRIGYATSAPGKAYLPLVARSNWDGPGSETVQDVIRP